MRDRARVGRRPILIAGGKGTLATAFARICAARGLDYELVSRAELDIADEVSVAAAFERFRPWAVVNAAGYVRVDEAEGDQDRCRRENTIGAQRLAEASWRRGLRLVCFSSDLVFDGRSRRRYREGDQVAPLSAYGRSKADAETAIRAACPDALIVRSSAFFGPWDQANAVHQAVSAFAADRPWRAPSDQRVSPTYVPDLVNVALDLLIDGGDGIWHLANDGDVSWSELARKVASATGYSSHLVEDCLTEELGCAAARPVYSVLGTDRGQRLPPLDDALARFVAERDRQLHRPRRGTAA
jgi:dTDP-4-dehydrorhamnose reductase